MNVYSLFLHVSTDLRVEVFARATKSLFHCPATPLLTALFFFSQNNNVTNESVEVPQLGTGRPRMNRSLDQ